MRTIELATATKPLSEYALEFPDEIIVLTSRQEPVAALVSLKNVDSESFLLSMNPEFMQIIETARAEFAAGKTLTLEEMRREVSEQLQELPSDKLAVVYDFVSYLLERERQQARFQFSEAFETMLASEAVLRRDWDRPEEDEAWASL